MSNVDRFESQFRSAAKPTFHWKPPEVGHALVVTDRDELGAAAFAEHMRGLLGPGLGAIECDTLHRGDFGDVASLLKLVGERDPDFICTYRHLHSDAWRWPFSLGSYVDVMTQAADCPVLLVAHPDREDAWPLPKRTDHVVAITDHLAGDARLVNWAGRFTAPDGTLHLTHVEDGMTFARYAEVLSKIPDIDTAAASAAIEAQLLKEPADYIESCRAELLQRAVRFTVEPTVTIGLRLREYERLIESHGADLLVMNTRDQDQLAMHGLAYPLAVELRDTPLLML